MQAGFWVFGSVDGADPLYGYEPDLRLQFTIPAFYGTGHRVFGLIRWTLREPVSLEWKGWFDRKSNGSGWTGGFRVQCSLTW